MTRQFPAAYLFLAAGLLSLLASGCAHSSQSLSAENKARFGYAGMPMPREAQKFMQQHAAGPSQPAGRQAAK